MLYEPPHTPPALAHTQDPLRRIAAILRHAARLRNNNNITVERVTIGWAGRTWHVTEDADGVEWWQDQETGTRRLGTDLTRHSEPSNRADAT